MVGRRSPARLQEPGLHPVPHGAGMPLVVYQKTRVQKFLGIFPGRFAIHLEMLLEIPQAKPLARCAFQEILQFFRVTLAVAPFRQKPRIIL